MVSTGTFEVYGAKYSILEYVTSTLGTRTLRTVHPLEQTHEVECLLAFVHARVAQAGARNLTF